MEEESATLAVIEGIDKTGKTTLVNELAKLLASGVDVRHAAKPTQHPLLEYELSLEGYEPGTVTHVLLDRWHVGERVWPSIYNRPSEYDDVMHRHVELFLVSRGALMVLAEGRESAIMERIDEDDFFEPEQVPEILSRFKHLYKRSILARSSFDFERDDVSNFAFSLLAGGFQLEREVHQLLALTKGYIGFSRPDVLYVGEQVEPGGTSVLPFVPFKNTSGWSLMQAMPRDQAIGIVNAFKPDGTPELLSTIHARVGRPYVVALGNKAHDALIEAKVGHGVVPHPQYVRRFHNAAIANGAYREMLVDAARGLDTRGRLGEEA